MQQPRIPSVADTDGSSEGRFMAAAVARVAAVGTS